MREPVATGASIMLIDIGDQADDEINRRHASDPVRGAKTRRLRRT